MCVCVYMCVYVSVCVDMCVYVCVCICVCVYVSVCVCAHVHVHTRVCRKGRGVFIYHFNTVNLWVCFLIQNCSSILRGILNWVQLYSK